MDSPAVSLDIQGALTCSRQRYLFRGIRRQHQTLKNLALLDKHDKRITTLRERLDAAEQDLFNLRHALREEEQKPAWPSWTCSDKTWHKPYVQRSPSQVSVDYTMESPRAPIQVSPARRSWTPRTSPLKQQTNPFSTPDVASVPTSPVIVKTELLDPFAQRAPPPRLHLPIKTVAVAAVPIATPIATSAIKQKRQSLLFDSKQRLKRVLRLKVSSPVA